MKRIVIIGSGGAGKSTLARRLGEILRIEVTHLDALYWHPGWVKTPEAVWQETIRDLLGRERWILDGNYGGTMALRVAAADTVIFLDLPRVVCLWRVLCRRVRFHGRARPDITPGCPEQIGWDFLTWIWSYPRRRRPGILRLLSENAAQKRIVHLRTPAEVKEFLGQLESTPAVAPQ